jgi:hypothetical protein
MQVLGGILILLFGTLVGVAAVGCLIGLYVIGTILHHASTVMRLRVLHGGRRG